jgi:hypothetical protein
MPWTFGIVFGFAVASLAVAQPPRLSGTYRIAICKVEPCSVDDTTNVVVGGILVLSDSQVTPAHFPEATVRRMTNSANRWRREGTNACFALQRRRLEPRTYAGIGEVALTNWTAVPGNPASVDFGLYRSPDAGNRVKATITAGALRGTGTSSGAGVAGVDWPDDIVVGRRVSDTDLKPCIDAVVHQISGPLRPPYPNLTTQLPKSDSTRHYLLFLSSQLLDEQDPPRGFSSNYYSFGNLSAIGGDSTVLAIGIGHRSPTPTAFADTVLARVRALRALGVAPSRISVVGVGKGTAIATDVASRLAEPVNYVFVGACQGATPIKPATATALHVLDVLTEDVPLANRCGSRFTPPTIVSEQLLAPAYGGGRAGRSGGNAGGGRPAPDRADEWVDDVVWWIKTRPGSGRR